MIKKLDNGKWYVEIYLGRDKITNRKIRKTKTCKTRKEAVEYERKTLQGNTINPPKTALTVAEYLEYWHDIHAVTNCRLQTQLRYKSIVKNISEKIGSIQLNYLTIADIEKLYYTMSTETIKLKNGKIKKRYMSGTILKHHKLLKNALNKAVALDLIIKNPAAFVSPPKDNIRNIKFWSLKESQMFFNYIKDHKIYLPALIAFKTGLRCGEICALRWQDINFGDGFLMVNHSVIEYNRQLILVPPKTNASKNIVYLDKFLLELLKDIFKDRNIRNNDKFICIHENGRQLRPLYLTKTFGILVNRFKAVYPNIPVITFHGLRHTHATILNEIGASPLEISQRIRHSRVSTTFNTYVHFNESLKKNTVNLLNSNVF